MPALRFREGNDVISFRQLGWVKKTEEGTEFTEAGLNVLGKLLEIVKPLPKIPKAIWLLIMSLVVPAAIELVLIRDGKAYAIPRKDKWWRKERKLHFSGSYISPREETIETVRRIANRETVRGTAEIEIEDCVIVGVHNNVNSPRFHDVSLIVVVTEFVGSPNAKGGEWIDTPDGLIEVHQPFWQFIEPHLEKSKTAESGT